MGYRIRVVPEVEVWLGELRDSDPGSARLVDEAVDALREAGAGLGPPLVVAAPAPQTRPDPDQSHRRLELLRDIRRDAAGAATTRKRLELQMRQLEAQVSSLAQQTRQGLADGPGRPCRQGVWASCVACRSSSRS